MALRDWRNPADYQAFESLDASGLAWEFLRRNPAYRAAVTVRTGASAAAPAAAEARPRADAGDAASRELPRDRDALAAAWGLRFAVDPDLDAFEAELFWRAEAAPAHVLHLAPSPAGGVSAPRLTALARASRRAEDGLHLRLSGGLQLVIAPPALASPLALSCPLDPLLAQRLLASAALDRALRAQPQAPRGLTLQRRRRFSAMLRTLDGRAEGASYRRLAEGVIGAVDAPGSAWRTASARDVMVRLLRGALQMTRGGYLQLLRRRA